MRAHITGPRMTTKANLVLDTGAAYTTIRPEVADELGYSARDGIRITRVRTAIGSEQGYVLVVAKFVALGLVAQNFRLQVFDLGEDIDGLIGLNLLNQLNYEVRSVERRVLVERAAAMTVP